MEYRTAYKKGPKVLAKISKKSRTKQSFKEECDINCIIKKAEQNGLITHTNKGMAQYGNFADPQTFQDSMNLVIYAQEQFMSLPARVRDRFANDPRQFLEFATNGDNAEEMAKLGLMDPEAVERVQKATSPKSEGVKKNPSDTSEGSKADVAALRAHNAALEAQLNQLKAEKQA